jgi:hypothetical protein
MSAQLNSVPETGDNNEGQQAVRAILEIGNLLDWHRATAGARGNLISQGDQGISGPKRIGCGPQVLSVEGRRSCDQMAAFREK